MAALVPVSRALFSYLRHVAAPPGLASLRGLARAAADIVFPPACLCCRKSIESEGALCSACWAQVRFIERPFCNRLGTPFATDYGSDEMLSPEAVSDPPVYARARAVAHFDDGPVRQLVHRLKYYDRWRSPSPLETGWPAPAASFWRRPSSSCLSPCIARASPHAGSIRPMFWCKPSRHAAACRPILSSSRGSSRRRLRSAFRARSGRSICKARFRSRKAWARALRAGQSC
jgi:Double zinc ribbon domain